MRTATPLNPVLARPIPLTKMNGTEPHEPTAPPEANPVDVPTSFTGLIKFVDELLQKRSPSIVHVEVLRKALPTSVSRQVFSSTISHLVNKKHKYKRSTDVHGELVLREKKVPLPDGHKDFGFKPIAFAGKGKGYTARRKARSTSAPAEEPTQEASVAAALDEMQLSFKVCGKNVTMPMSEARALHQQLTALFGK